VKTYSSQEMRTIFNKKGCFHEKKKRDHHYFFLMVDGKKTNIFTKISHSVSIQYSDWLLSRVQKQLRLQTEKDKFEKLLICTFQGQDYISYLKQSGYL